jgi:hypothetical protein
VILNYRLHNRSVSEKKQQMQIENMRLACQQACQRRGIQREFKGALPWRPDSSRDSRHQFALRYGWWAFKSRQRATSLVYGVRAISINPLKLDGWRLFACAALKKLPSSEQHPAA